MEAPMPIEAPRAAASFRRLIADPSLQRLYDFWLARRGDRPLMLRADLDPTAIPRLLPCLKLADVAEGGRAIRYRLVGTEIVKAHGFDFTGRTFEEIATASSAALVRALYGTVVTQAVPVYSEGHFRWADKEHRWTRRLHLPLSRAGAAVDLVLSGQVFELEAPGLEELVLPATIEQLAADRASLG